MAKATPRKHSARTPPVEDPTDAPPVPITSLTSIDLAFLQRVARFLVNILNPGYAEKARRERYSNKEHALGWQLWRTAAGETRPFEHWLVDDVSDGLEGNADPRQRLQELDELENTWFPRTRAIIRRVVPKERRDHFAAAFFKDLVQQPLGPAVVGSVGMFVERIDGLDASGNEDAKAVRDMLRSRGLDDARMGSIKKLLHDAKTGPTPDEKEGVGVTTASLHEARAPQLEALGGLRDWFNDWGTTLRPRFATRDQLRLGLVVRRAGGSVTEEETADELDGDDDLDEPVATRGAR